MKNSLAIIAGLALMGAAANADVAFNANNYGTGNAIGGLTAAGWVEILYTPTGGVATSLGVFQPTEPGFFDNGGMSIPGATGTSASLTVQAWNGAATYAAATDANKGSVTFTQSVAAWDPAAQPPAPKSGPDLSMPAFTLGSGGPIVPEPSTIALGMLGAAALLIRRRK
jgi:hypothetical protein